MSANLGYFHILLSVLDDIQKIVVNDLKKKLPKNYNFNNNIYSIQYDHESISHSISKTQLQKHIYDFLKQKNFKYIIDFKSYKSDFDSYVLYYNS